MNRYLITLLLLMCGSAIFAVNKAVVCGVSDYPDAPDNYCDADAKAVAYHLGALSDWSSSNITLLTNEQAGRSAILAAVNGMISNTTAQDVCLFFFFGQSDTSMINAWDAGITFNEISTTFANMPYGNYAIFIDMGLPHDTTYQASLVPLQYGEANGFTLLSYYEYLDDPAYEYAKNSPFAYLLLEALSGHGDSNNNGVITARECAAYVDPTGSDTRTVDQTSGVNITAMNINGGDIYETDSFYLNIPVVQTDGTPLLRAISPSGEYDYIQFTLGEETTVEIETNAAVIGADTDTVLTLFNSAGAEVASNDDNPGIGISGYYLSKITETLAAGTYRVMSECYYSNDEILSYSVRVSDVGTSVYAAGPDFVYENISAQFLCLLQSYYDDLQVAASWQSDDPAAAFGPEGYLNASSVSGDTIINVSASYEGAVSQKDVTVRDMAAPVSTVEYYAVICGIADYPGTSNDLTYTVNDAVGLRNQLIKDPMWKSENITLLLDEEATYDAIRNSILAMATLSDSDDVCLFFYSGHGTEKNDYLPYDESDGVDEYLVAYNADISDDNFGQWINELPTDNYIVLIDSCYSGGHIKSTSSSLAVKGLGKLVSEKGDGFAADIYSSVIGIEDLNDNGRGVVLTASDDDELSWESSTLAHGTFTYYLLEALEGAADIDNDGFVSAEECYDYIYPLALYDQTTQIYDPGRLDMPVMQYNAAAYIKSLEIVGLSSLMPGAQASFTCNAVFSDGSRADVTEKVRWSVDNGYAVVSDQGVVTAGYENAGEQFALDAVYNNIFSASLTLIIENVKYSGGDGTRQSPYVIANAYDMVKLSQTPADWNGHFVVANDIDMTGVSITPIGVSISEPFNGVFDGGGSEIRSLYINTNGNDYAGLFAVLGAEGSVSDLGLYDVDINSGDGNFAGSLAGWCFGSISRCFASGSVSGAAQAGGLVGGLSGVSAVIEDCYCLCDVTASLAGGGFAAIIADNAVISRCVVSGEISGEGNLAPFVYYYYSPGNVLNCFYDASMGAGASGIASPLESSELKSSNAYIAAGWDFSAQGVWKIKQGYVPMLSWQADFLPGDFDESGAVDTGDLILLGGNWLADQGANPCDISKYGGDGKVDMKDFAVFGIYYFMD